MRSYRGLERARERWITGEKKITVCESFFWKTKIERICYKFPPFVSTYCAFSLSLFLVKFSSVVRFPLPASLWPTIYLSVFVSQAAVYNCFIFVWYSPRVRFILYGVPTLHGGQEVKLCDQFPSRKAFSRLTFYLVYTIV